MTTTNNKSDKSLLSEIVFAHIPEGKENAISRAALAAKLGMSDRQMREAVSIARREGFVIINDQDGKGYYRSDDIEELQRQLTQTHNRALALLAQEKSIKRQIADVQHIGGLI